ncbi:core-2/I-branching enzyme-domain-containing protein [Cladochytrium replicatum]|nr:core-2/I-branching enzyme-domain-containing protein [Cladochytrium replicatum]
MARWASHPAREIEPCDIVRLIEFHAESVARRVRQQAAVLQMHELNDEAELMRFSCYEAALGNNFFVGNNFINPTRYDNNVEGEVSSIHTKPFLMHVHGPTYFPALEGMRADSDEMARQSENSAWCTYDNGPSPERGIKIATRHALQQRKPHYHLAYLILGYKSAGNVKILLDRLWHPTDVIIGIHIDLDNAEMKTEVELHVHKYYPRKQNIIFIDSLQVMWGKSSIVLAQLRGFFKLSEIASWDHIFNLSENDYPLATTKQIRATLRKNVNYIRWYQSGQAQTARLQNVCLKYNETRAKCRRGAPPDSPPEVKLYWRRKFPCGKWNTKLKNSQWMILSQAFVETLRRSPAAANALAFAEHSEIPDESYFALIVGHSPWSSNYINDANSPELPFGSRNDSHNGTGAEGSVVVNNTKTNQIVRLWTDKRNHRFLKMKRAHPEKLNIETFNSIAIQLCGPSAIPRPDGKNAGSLTCIGRADDMRGHMYLFARKIMHTEEQYGLLKYIDENYNLGPWARLASAGFKRRPQQKGINAS